MSGQADPKIQNSLQSGKADAGTNGGIKAEALSPKAAPAKLTMDADTHAQCGKIQTDLAHFISTHELLPNGSIKLDMKEFRSQEEADKDVARVAKLMADSDKCTEKGLDFKYFELDPEFRPPSPKGRQR